ncbi:hypothetical protein [Undibacterium sp. RuTC16W]|uniref:hypothetical protein n=1 Tax=Undibacterium sp. RuTC16W TaxID=3413048 RepID=UPI003BF07BCB
MKYLGLPEYDDIDIIRELAKKDNLASFPLLANALSEVEAEYKHYKKINGNVLALNEPIEMDANLKEGMRQDYKKKLVILKYISEIRKKLSPTVCPMCGSLGSSQVDHLAPKAIYPEFALFSHNLVPACSCNGKKSIAFKGNGDERVLHPYYDMEILSTRLSYIAFSGDVKEPDLTVELTLKEMTNSAVKFHIDTIVRKTNILEWASAKWEKMKEDPESLIFFDGHDGLVNAADVQLALCKRFEMSDKEHGTKNNWFSMFFYGLALREKNEEHIYIRNRVNELRKARS